MAADVNNVTLIGHLTKDPEVRFVEGTAHYIAMFTLAVNGIREEDTSFISCKAFGKTAEVLDKYGRKGKQIALTGRISTSTYKKGETTLYRTDVIADRIQLLGTRADNIGSEAPAQTSNDFVEASDSDLNELPFN